MSNMSRNALKRRASDPGPNRTKVYARSQVDDAPAAAPAPAPAEPRVFVLQPKGNGHPDQSVPERYALLHGVAAMVKHEEKRIEFLNSRRFFGHLPDRLIARVNVDWICP